MKTFYLDLNKEELFVFEKRKSDLTIDAIIRGIKHNDDFPAVPVFEVGGKYYLSWHEQVTPELNGSSPFDNVTDGGHARAVGHYISNAKLKVRLVSQDSITARYFPISNVIIADDKGEYEERKKRFEKYR